jgi:hypothetical protein
VYLTRALCLIFDTPSVSLTEMQIDDAELQLLMAVSQEELTKQVTG